MRRGWRRRVHGAEPAASPSPSRPSPPDRRHRPRTSRLGGALPAAAPPAPPASVVDDDDPRPATPARSPCATRVRWGGHLWRQAAKEGPRLSRMRRLTHRYAEDGHGSWMHVYLFETRDNLGATQLRHMLFVRGRRRVLHRAQRRRRGRTDLPQPPRRRRSLQQRRDRLRHRQRLRPGDRGTPGRPARPPPRREAGRRAAPRCSSSPSSPPSDPAAGSPVWTGPSSARGRPGGRDAAIGRDERLGQWVGSSSSSRRRRRRPSPGTWARLRRRVLDRPHPRPPAERRRRPGEDQGRAVGRAWAVDVDNDFDALLRGRPRQEVAT